MTKRGAFTIATYSMGRRHRPIQSRNTVTMWIELRIAQLGSDSGLEVFRNEMFQAFGLFMHLFQWIVENFVEERLD